MSIVPAVSSVLFWLFAIVAVALWSINVRGGPVCPAALEPLEHSHRAPADTFTAAPTDALVYLPVRQCQPQTNAS